MSKIFINSKTIIIFRNPIDIALSAWDHNHRLFEKEKFDEHLNIMKVNGDLNLDKYIIHRSKVWNNQVKNLFLQINNMPEKFLAINYDIEHRSREQDIKNQFEENGSIYICKTKNLRSFKNRLSGKVGFY